MFFPFSYGFSHRFPMIFPFSYRVSHCFPMIFPSRDISLPVVSGGCSGGFSQLLAGDELQHPKGTEPFGHGALQNTGAAMRAFSPRVVRNFWEEEGDIDRVRRVFAKWKNTISDIYIYIYLYTYYILLYYIAYTYYHT